MKGIVLSADCACDLGAQLKEKYGVHYFHFHVQLGEESFLDGKEIGPQEIYSYWEREHVMAKTAAITPEEYSSCFTRWVEEGNEVIHLSMGSYLSSAHQNSTIAAQELEGVYTIDSGNLSAGIGLLVIKAAELIGEGRSAKEVAQAVTAMVPKVRAAFVLDTLEYMQAGGRCSNFIAMSANLLKIKPSIRVLQEENGKIVVGKKYRGSMEKVLTQFAADHLTLAPGETLDTSRVFITNSGSPDGDVEVVRPVVEAAGPFDEVHLTKTSSTIAVHCGPRTLGVGYMVN